MRIKNIKAVTVRKSIIPDRRRVVLQPVGAGMYRIVEAETNDHELRSTHPPYLISSEGGFRSDRLEVI